MVDETEVSHGVKVKVEIEIWQIRYVKEFDVHPDLSWLDQDDDTMGPGWEAYAAERKEAYDRGDWYMLGIYAEVLTTDEYGNVTVFARSPGLWGTESDSNDEHFRAIATDERANLAVTLAGDRNAFNDVPTEWVER